MQIADIVTEYGAYYQNQGQNLSRLHQVARVPFETESALTPVITDDTVWTAAKSTISRLVQPFQKKFTPLGQAEFKPVKIEMQHMKADSEEAPDDLEATWLGFLASGNLKRSEWPYIRYYLESLFFPKIQEDLELNEIFKGVHAAPADGTPGAISTSMDGLKKIFAGHITAGRITPITMGVIPTDPEEFVDYVEDFGDLIDKRYWNGAMQLNMAQDLQRRFERGQRKKYGKNTVDNAQDLIVKSTNLTVKGLPSHNGSGRIWCTPKGNAVLLKKKTQNQKLVDIQTVDRLVKFLTDWWMGTGFIIPEIVFCNDQA
ncbi:hypothetical protein ACFQ4C_17995 [Larkinella insperata]|uniref:Uncharacterized protein n=1 Tax=Larkinella insperata TaxID=332158 RepID=A0ABW3QK91_9BACT|nr:hypothetical protein [Larkinella insperata]